MRQLFGLSRRDLFEKVERDASTPCPRRLGVRGYGGARGSISHYHIEVHDFLYSVPHALIRARGRVRITAHTVRSSIVASASAPISAVTWPQARHGPRPLP